MIILISGSDNTGRESVRNLILHKIALLYGAKPLQVNATLSSLNIADNIRSVAYLFMHAYRRSAEETPAFADLKATYDDQTGEANIGARDNYSTLFQVWREDVKPCKRPIVLLAEGGNNHDLWRAIYDSTAHLFRFIIVLTKDEHQANVCYNALHGKGRVFVKAKPLELMKAQNYLEMRLAEERDAAANPPNNLMPFTKQALDALYEPGKMYKPGEPLAWSIGWLNETFSTVLDDHIKNLRLLLKEQGREVTDLKPHELLIGADTMRAVRERLDRG
jgi:hypothetical protein